MTVGEFITRLQQYDPAVPVALADWNEEYQWPSTTDDPDPGKGRRT